TSIGGFAEWTDLTPAPPTGLKNNVPGLDFINLINPVSYRQTTKSGDKIQRSVFVAEQVQTAAEAVNFSFAGIDVPATPNGRSGIRYSTFVVPLVKAVQELSVENDQLKGENETQELVISDLESRMEKMEAMMQQLVHAQTETRTNGSQTVSLSDVQLAQNEPNPFSDYTAIPYSLPNFVQTATLEISNANGQIIKSVAIDNRGEGQIVLETKMLGNGTYFYTLVVDELRQATKQMVVVK
ncbi:MAG: T9SS type A sorting domain-containing protein, partial [Saprospiraceae bacterium]